MSYAREFAICCSGFRFSLDFKEKWFMLGPPRGADGYAPACLSNPTQRLRLHKKGLALNLYLTFSIRPDTLHSCPIIKGQIVCAAPDREMLLARDANQLSFFFLHK